MNLPRSKRKIVNNTRNTYVLGQNTSKYRSPIIVVHVYATVFFFLKFAQSVTIL